MPRIVRHTVSEPIKIDPSTWPRDAEGNLKAIFVCACGISARFPICDGTHKKCRDESPNVDYAYDPTAGTRTPLSPTPPSSSDASTSTG
mgnify:CR=1 FL=1